MRPHTAREAEMERVMDWRSYRRPSPLRVPVGRRGLSATLALAAAATVPLAPAALAGVIDDKAFFDELPTTTITFEVNGAGNPVSLIEGQTMTMPASAYAAQGVMFQSPIAWVNDGGVDFINAQFLGGSPEIAIPSAAVSTFTIEFTVPVRSVGMFVANTHAMDASGPTFVARDAQGDVIEMVSFGTQTSGSQFVDGRAGSADYGFMGIFSATPIATLTVTKQSAIFDDLMFSSEIPAPAGALLLGGAGCWLIGRRRR